MTGPTLDELRERLAEARGELDRRHGLLTGSNGSQPGDVDRAEAADYAEQVLGDLDRIMVVFHEREPDGLRRKADDLRAFARGGAADFRDEDGYPIDPLPFARHKTRLPSLRRVVKHGPSNALYDLELSDERRIPLGTSGDLMNPRRVEAAVADATGVAIPYFTPKRWRPVAAALLAIAETEDTGSSEAEETAGWVASLADLSISASAVPIGDSERLARILRAPDDEPVFRGDDDRLYLRIDRLVRHVTHGVGARTTRRDLAARLGRIGFKKTQLSARDREGAAKARYWISPVGFDPGEEA